MRKTSLILVFGDAVSALMVAWVIGANLPASLVVATVLFGASLTVSLAVRESKEPVPYLPHVYVYMILNQIAVTLMAVYPIQMGVVCFGYLTVDYLRSKKDWEDKTEDKK